LPALDPSVDVLLKVGDRDNEAGSAGADEFWAPLDALIARARSS
jgi:hypothetical protein